VIEHLLPTLLDNENLTFDKMVDDYNCRVAKKKNANDLVFQVSMQEYYGRTLVNDSRAHREKELLAAPQEIRDFLKSTKSSRTGNLAKLKDYIQ
jgi:hypothetical protein